MTRVSTGRVHVPYVRRAPTTPALARRVLQDPRPTQSLWMKPSGRRLKPSCSPNFQGSVQRPVKSRGHSSWRGFGQRSIDWMHGRGQVRPDFVQGVPKGQSRH